MPSATIKMFLVHGDPKRLRTAELSGWTGKAVAGPRSEFDGVLAREEAGKAGIYFLRGVDAESGKPAIYVGEAEVIRDRAIAHLARDFWNQIVFFASKDDNLTKPHIRYLEGKLIENALHSGRATVVNGVSSGSRLPESDRADMDIFHEKVNQLLPGSESTCWFRPRWLPLVITNDFASIATSKACGPPAICRRRASSFCAGRGRYLKNIIRQTDIRGQRRCAIA